jgi:hypothetical protein
MEERLEWVREKVGPICEALGVKVPEVVVQEEKMMGPQEDVVVTLSQSGGPRISKNQPQPILLMSRHALTDWPDRLLEFRVALALAGFRREHSKALKRQMAVVWYLAAGMIVVCVVQLLALPQPQATAATRVCILAYWAAVGAWGVVASYRIRPLLVLDAAQLTSDPETALQFMREWSDSRPNGPPWRRWWVQRQVAHVERELRKRGLAVG